MTTGNDAVFLAARQAGCTFRQAEVLAVYVDSETMADAARKLSISEHTVKLHLAAVRAMLKAPHIAAAVAHLVSPVSSKN